VKNAYRAIFDTENLKTPPGPKLTQLIYARVGAFASRPPVLRPGLRRGSGQGICAGLEALAASRVSWRSRQRPHMVRFQRGSARGDALGAGGQGLRAD